MSGIMTRWLILQEHLVTSQDLDHDGAIVDATVERWVAAARSAYLDRCVLLRQTGDQAGVTLGHRTGALPSGAHLGRPTSVVVTASAAEVRPSSFTISVRLRPLGGDRDTALNATCTIMLEDKSTGEAQPLGDEIRDELIALEHSAEHFN